MWFTLALLTLGHAVDTVTSPRDLADCERFVDVPTGRSESHEVAEILRWIALVHPAQDDARTTARGQELKNLRALASAFTLYPPTKLAGRTPVDVATRLVNNLVEIHRVLGTMHPAATRASGQFDQGAFVESIDVWVPTGFRVRGLTEFTTALRLLKRRSTARRVAEFVTAHLDDIVEVHRADGTRAFDALAARMKARIDEIEAEAPPATEDRWASRNVDALASLAARARFEDRLELSRAAREVQFFGPPSSSVEQPEEVYGPSPSKDSTHLSIGAGERLLFAGDGPSSRGRGGRNTHLGGATETSAITERRVTSDVKTVTPAKPLRLPTDPDRGVPPIRLLGDLHHALDLVIDVQAFVIAEASHIPALAQGELNPSFTSTVTDWTAERLDRVKAARRTLIANLELIDVTLADARRLRAWVDAAQSALGEAPVDDASAIQRRAHASAVALAPQVAAAVDRAIAAMVKRAKFQDECLGRLAQLLLRGADVLERKIAQP